jgi:hypothetical protein
LPVVALPGLALPVAGQPPAAGARGAHRIASLAQLVAQRVDLAADSSDDNCFAGLHQLTAERPRG